MEAIFLFIQSHFPIILTYRYLFLFLGATLEGFNSLVLGGFLASIGAVKFIPLFLIFLLGEVINGYIWYFVGFFAGAKPLDRWVRNKKKGKEILEKVESYFGRFSGRALIITRLTLSLTVATLIMAGSLKYNFKKFSLYNFLGAGGWVALTVGVGYFFGEGYKLFFIYIRSISYFLIFLAAAIFFAYLSRWFFTSAFVRSLIITERLREFGNRMRDGLDKILSDNNKDH